MSFFLFWKDFSVSHYASNGSWRWDIIYKYVPSSICDKIVVIKPYSLRKPNFRCWKATFDGYFSLKFAYDMLHCSSQLDARNDESFAKIWFWKRSTKYRAFLWKLAHGKVLTNVERIVFGIVKRLINFVVISFTLTIRVNFLRLV